MYEREESSASRHVVLMERENRKLVPSMDKNEPAVQMHQSLLGMCMMKVEEMRGRQRIQL